MGDKSEIQWTDATWNPVTGCSKVSPGCAHCYAESLTRRFADTWGVPDLPWTPANAAENVRLHPERLDQPLRWKRPRMIFVNSMSDLFHEEIPDAFIGQVLNVMALAPRHTFQVLTKRPERMRNLVRRWYSPKGLAGYGNPTRELGTEDRPVPNVWLGVSIENRRYVDRADLLRETPAAVRFISAEPLLGPLVYEDGTFERVNGVVGEVRHWSDDYAGDELDLRHIDWLIVGGESGPGHRPMRANWVRDLLTHVGCVSNDLPSDRTAFFFKQWGGATPKAGGRELDGRTWDEMPTTRETA
jgi:protein gp37